MLTWRVLTTFTHFSTTVLFFLVFSSPSMIVPPQRPAVPDGSCQKKLISCSGGGGSNICDFMEWILPIADLEENSLSVKVDVMNSRPKKPIKNASYPSKEELPELRLVATRDISNGQVILSLPQELVVSSNDLISDGFRPFSSPPLNKDNIPLAILASWLLHEKSKGIDSFWHPYISIFPKHVPTPIFYSDRLISEIDDEHLVKELLMRKRDVVSMYENSDKETVANATMAEFEWAMTIVWSRTFSIKFRGSEFDLVMIPFFDFMNHDDDFQADWQRNSNGGVEIYAKTDLKAGQEVFTLYGHKTNTDYFMWYGFVSETNIFDAVSLFADYKEAVAYHVANFSQYDFDDVAIEWANYIAREAMAAVTKAIDAEEESKEFLWGTRGMTDRFKDMPFSIATRGRIDPSMMAALASVWFYDVYGEEPDYKSLAKLSLLFGYDAKSVTCAILYDYPEGLSNAITAALAIIYDSIRVKIQSFKTTLAEDQETLLSIQECRARMATHPQNCAQVSTNEWVDKETLIRYQIQRKFLLQNCMARILQLCPQPQKDVVR